MQLLYFIDCDFSFDVTTGSIHQIVRWGKAITA